MVSAVALDGERARRPHGCVVTAVTPTGGRALGARRAHADGARAATATLIGADRVLIAGGMSESGGALREYEVFDASRNRIIAWGEMMASRAGHTATRLADGRVLILGGYDGSYLSSAEIFDPRTSTFGIVAGDLGHAYSFASAVMLDDGRAVVLGGYDESRRNTDGIWIFRQ